MNEEEFEAFQSVNTKKHLDALRSHLMENKRDLYQHYDQLTVNGKPHEAELLKRFVTGSYEGKPSRPSLPPKKKSVWLTYVLYFVSIPVLVGLCAAAYLQLKSQEVDLSQLFFTIMTSIRAKFNL